MAAATRLRGAALSVLSWSHDGERFFYRAGDLRFPARVSHVAADGAMAFANSTKAALASKGCIDLLLVIEGVGQPGGPGRLHSCVN